TTSSNLQKKPFHVDLKLRGDLSRRVSIDLPVPGNSARSPGVIANDRVRAAFTDDSTPALHQNTNNLSPLEAHSAPLAESRNFRMNLSEASRMGRSKSRLSRRRVA